MNEQILRPALGGTVVVVIASLAFVGLAVSGAIEPVGLSLAIGGFGALGALAAGVQLLPGASHLRVNSQGIEIRSWFRSHVYRWEDIHSFQVGKIGAQRMVMMNFSSSFKRQSRLRGVAKALTGSEGALPDSYGMKHERLAEMLNEIKKRAS